MKDCCESKVSEPVEKTPIQNCSECEVKGRKVNEITPKSVLKPQALARYEPGQYYFCALETCSIVYFNPIENIVFKKSDIEVTVWQKDGCNDPTVLVCYCFGYSEASIKDRILKNPTVDIQKTIKDHVKAGRCACEIKNPQGNCCLGNVGLVIKKIGS